ncbi:rhodopsin-like [Haliotis rufescens]|uniref:rhodopsin-like n=1 Tax=Haliotis rufescens TaxID=6454 RepID=UPI00201EFBF0|nr:rhodopsin-like [Haliotis rufescens]
MTNVASQVWLGASLVLIAVVTLVVNIIVLVVWIKSPKLRDPKYYFWINLVVVDLIGVCMWTSLSVTAVVGDAWILPDVVCNVHAYFSTFCNTINLHTLTILALERFLKFFKPSKHEDICIGFFLTLLICGVWFFDGVVCVFTAVHWAQVRYYPDQYQCIPEHQLSTSHMNFMFILSYGIPLVVMIGCYSACFIKVFHMRSRVQPTGALVLETNKSAKGDSYSERMKRYSEKFQNAGMKNKKPKLEKTYDYTKDGYVVTSDTEDDVQQRDTKTKFKKKEYSLAKEDYMLLKVYVITSCAYVGTWIPYVISSYVWTYSRFSPLPAGVITSLVWLCHCGAGIKPLVYGLCFGKFRERLLAVLRRQEP